MDASSLLVQEIWDEILDYLHSSRKDLLSSALACRALTPGAQKHLFYCIQLDSGLKASQLVQILSSSPHLIAYIRDLEINPYNSETLTPIAQVPWSRVSAISLVKRGDAEEPALELLLPLISLPTLRRVSIRDGPWDTLHLRAVLANCSPHVTTLAFLACSTKIYASPPSRRDDPALLPSSSPPRITHLEIMTPTTVGRSISGFLVDPLCPLDLSRLLHVKCVLLGVQSLIRLLHAAGRNVQSLDIQALDLERLDMRAFPALSHVTVRGRGKFLRGAIERCCEGSVRTICHPLEAWMTTTHLDTIRSVILSAAPRALRRVEVVVSSTGPRRAEWIALIRRRMPELSESGMLAITFP
ncbi:hypothetical protein B0H14DRAFT_3868195 [Mycena olivaceomarginata]|nr:hypothetical protein B0H14DRAFT_3868195 [Mycena olivaceomarginata]